jgi:site-specific DNA-cytosine methylase
MLIFDFFSGTGSSTKAFKDAGHTVISFELDDFFEATENVDVTELSADYLLSKYGKPDFVWASPPCTTFSVASIRHYWDYVDGVAVPKNDKTLKGIAIVAHTRKLIEELSPTKGFLIENPRGMLRKQSVVAELPRHTITYCQYGDNRQKPTDLWGYVPNWSPKEMCKRGAPCHESARRGEDKGTQSLGGGGKRGSMLRSMVAPGLSIEILEALSK